MRDHQPGPGDRPVGPVARRRRRGCAVRAVRAALIALVVLGCGACGGASPDGAVVPDRPAATGSGASDATAFPAGAPADYQLGGAYAPPAGVRIVVRDSTARPEPGTYGICYVNAFQTQPGTPPPEDLLLRDGTGAAVRDPDWPDEYLLDTSTPPRRDALAGRLSATVRGCARAGFAAVEFDNLDSAARSGGALTDDANLALAARLVRVAHDAGLLAGQKNAAELGARGRAEAGFDFAVAEQCVSFDECSAYTSVYGDRVLGVEYTDDLDGDPCAAPDRPRTTVVRDRGLVRPGDPGYAYRQC